jgi:Tol biopolymer transport system component
MKLTQGLASKVTAPLLVAFLAPIIARAQWIQPVSLSGDSGSPAAGGSGDSVAPVMSADGRYVLFASTANNLVTVPGTNAFPAQFPARMNAYLRDRTNGSTTLISLNLAGNGGGNGDSFPISISTNGHYVLFESNSSDLVPGDTNNVEDVFIRDLLQGTTILVSTGITAGLPDRLTRSSTMTPDGHYVAFNQQARSSPIVVRDRVTGTNLLVTSQSNESPEITPDGRYLACYRAMEVQVIDLWTGTTNWASSGALAALQATFGAGVTRCVSYSHAISDNGQFVVYQTHSVAFSMPLAALVLRYNLQSGLTDIVATNAAVPLMASQTPQAQTQTPFRDQRVLQITPDGEKIVFIASTNTAAVTNTCILLWNALDGSTTLVSTDLKNSVPANSQCSCPSVDPSGRCVLFVSNATNLTANVLRGDFHLYLRDLQLGTTTLVDVDTDGVGRGVNAAAVPSMSDDGRFVAFEASDASLVPGDANRAADVFVRDLASGTTELISARHPDLPDLAPNGPSMLSSFGLSGDARYVAFVSEADNLVSNDTNGCRDLFVRDTLLGTNLLVSGNRFGTGTANGPSGEPGVSADGRWVVFSSFATNLVAEDNNNAQDVFVRDLEAGATTLVSVNTNATGPGNGLSYRCIVSSDGRRVLFRSRATNLAAGSANTGNDCLFLRDLQAGVTYPLTVNRSASLLSSDMTPDGRYVAWVESGPRYYLWDSQTATRTYTNTMGGTWTTISLAPDGSRIACASSTALPQFYVLDCVSNLNSSFSTPGYPVVGAGMRFSADSRLMTYVAGTTVARRLLYLYDFVSRASTAIASLGAEVGACGSPSISPDGRFVAFRSLTNNIVGDSNGLPDLFLYDRQTGATTLLSVSQDGQTTGQSWPLTPVFSADGQTLVFQGWGSDLAPCDYNRVADIFMVRLFSSSPIPLFAARIIPGASPAQNPTISWPVIPGRSYHLQYKHNLNDPDWQDITGGISLVGNTGYFNDPTPASDQRFYRIVAN